MAIMTSRTEGFQRWSADEFNYCMQTDIYRKDRYGSVTLATAVQNEDDKDPVSLLVFPWGECELHGRFKITKAVARGDVLFTLPLACQLATLINLVEGGSSSDIDIIPCKLSGTEVKAGKAITASSSKNYGFFGNRIVPMDKGVFSNLPS